ncbi:MAG TPA: DUF554 domain-containing protein [Paenibacillaceae bacterium]|nr:DUF554 domain-containing protein [Paenibacillaceae bacterium]
MILLGTIVNALAIIIGSLLGQTINGMKDNVKNSIVQVIGLCVVVMGIEMGLSSNNFIIVIFSIVIGTLLGEWWALEDKLEGMGNHLERWVGKKGQGNISAAFVSATIIYCVGAMAILGSLDSGIRHDHQLLLTKSLLDGFTAILFASTMGIGVIFSAIPVFLYQSAITLSAYFIQQFISDDLMEIMINELTATGGIMIIAIGINMLGIKKIRVANMLPSIIIVVIGVYLLHKFQVI